MLFRSNDTATTEIYTVEHTLSLHDALPIWAHDPASERDAFVAVIDHIYRRVAMPGFEKLRVYHFGHYEPSALRRLSTRYAVEEARLDALFREGRFVDLSRVTSQGLRIGVESYSLNAVFLTWPCLVAKKR